MSTPEELAPVYDWHHDDHGHFEQQQYESDQGRADDREDPMPEVNAERAASNQRRSSCV